MRIALALPLVLLVIQPSGSAAEAPANPLLSEWTTPFEVNPALASES